MTARTMLALALTAVALGADLPIKPITVCDAIADASLLNGKDVAVIGRWRPECKGGKLVADHCERRTETNGYVWPNSLWLDVRDNLGPDPPGGTLVIDESALGEKRTLNSPPAILPTPEGWTVFYGRIETRETLEPGKAFGPAGDNPIQLTLKNRHKLEFTFDGRPAQTIFVGNCGLIEVEDRRPIAASLCDVAREPQRYYGKLVQVRTAISRFGADGGAALLDQTCSAMVRFDVADQGSIKSDPSYQALDRLLGEGSLVDATFLGRVALVLILNEPQNNYLRFAAQSVSNVVVEPVRNVK